MDFIFEEVIKMVNATYGYQYLAGKDLIKSKFQDFEGLPKAHPGVSSRDEGTSE